MSKTKYGYFIVIEGCDGAGKSTIAQMLKDKLVEDGYDTIYTREPGGIRAGEMIREIVKTNKLTPEQYLLLFAASMSININQIINPALEDKKIVICDRFVRSTYIYQGFADYKENESVYDYLIRKDYFNEIEKCACYNCSPDIEFILDVDPKVAWGRTHSRGEKTDVFESNGYKFIEKIANHYIEQNGDELFYTNLNDCEIIHINANRETNKVFEDCYHQIITMIEEDNNA